jgi:putative protease
MVNEKLAELGETEFFVENSEVIYDGKAFLPFTLLKELRNKGVDMLRREIIEKSRRRKEEKGIFTEKYKSKEEIDYRVTAMALTKEQEDILKKVGIEKIYRNFGDKNIADSFEDIENNNITAVDWMMNNFNSYTFKFYEKFSRL